MSLDPRADVEIAAEAAARELRLSRSPHVELHGDEHVSARERLPRRLRVGATYRRVAAAMRLTARAGR
jgi:hypothetical protein